MMSVETSSEGCRCPVQWLIYNDCLFRWRQTYEYILFVDRDEFLHFSGKPLSEVRMPLLSEIASPVNLSFAVTLSRHHTDVLHCNSCSKVEYQSHVLGGMKTSAMARC